MTEYEYDVVRSPEDYVRDAQKNGASDEPEGFWHWVNTGIGRFKLSGPTLVHFLDRCIEALQSRGAVPCEPGHPTYADEWVELPLLGDTPDAIRARVINDWLETGGGPMEPWSGVWFGLPHQVVPLSDATPAPPRKPSLITRPIRG